MSSTKANGGTATTDPKTPEEGTEVQPPPPRDFSEQEEMIQSLHRMEASLQAMSTVPSAPLSHYRVLPNAVKEAYEIMQQGAALIHGTSTKYTLLGKLDTVEQTKLSHDLRQGCELLATACLVLHEASTGSSHSLRHSVIQASRAIIATTTQLMEAYTQGEAWSVAHENMGAQKTGAVWQTCSVILDKKLPLGNRNAMRRDLFTYVSECQETMDEFQELVDEGPVRKTDDDAQSTPAETSEPEDTWESFLGGQNEQYGTPKELAVAEAALAFLKLSRGTLKLSLQVLDAVGDQLHESNNNDNDDKMPPPSSAEREARLEWMRLLHEECCAVGKGVTDLGTTLYPPLKMSDVALQLTLQINRLEKVLDHVIDACITVHDQEQETNREVSLELHVDISSMAGKLKTALTKRKQEAATALQAAGVSLTDI